jgi:hypothetical protein
MFVRPEEERFLSEELIRMSTFTAGRDELGGGSDAKQQWHLPEKSFRRTTQPRSNDD